MRVVIDMQGLQTESRFRGVGRYTMSFVQAVVRNRGDHEIILALSGLFPDTIAPIRAAFNGLLPQENIRVFSLPGPLSALVEGNERLRKVASVLREAFLASLNPDVIHISSLFEGYVDDAIVSIGEGGLESPVSVVLYDLIPLLNSDNYLRPNPSYESFYRRQLEYLKRASLLLAISEFSREEGIDALEVDEKKVVNISTAIDANFQKKKPFSGNSDSQVVDKFGIRRPFVLYTGGSDGRKNLPRLIEAYAALSQSTRAKYQLIFAGRMPEGDVDRFKGIAKSAGLKADELLFVGYVSDEELVQLYSQCRLFVFPSWHEGFGLPALEAMACGAPVIGANTSSLPEVIGYDEALFDPYDVAAISYKIKQGLEDDYFRNRLREYEEKQSKKFSWDKTALRAIKAWEDLPQKPSRNQEAWGEISRRLAGIYQRLVQGIASISTTDLTLTDMELRQIARCIEKNEREINRYLRPVSLPERLTWRIEGPFDSSYSLALVNREIARALAQQGHQVVLHSTEGGGDFAPNKHFLLENPDLAEMYHRSTEVMPIDADVVSRDLYPPRVDDMVARFNFLHAYGWEETGVPQEWIDSFNSSLQGMTVLSEHVQKLMIDNGVSVPVEVCGAGVDHWLQIQVESGFEIEARSFRFLHVSSCFPRKGADVLLRAYGRAFCDSDDVTLVIKTFPNPHNEIHEWLAAAKAGDLAFPDVLILEADYSDSQLKALYEQCHALVAPSRAEGFGLPMAEAILSGLPVITTDWSGQKDFCKPETAWLIDYSYERAKTHFGLSSSVWAEPDEGHLTDLMQEVFRTPHQDRQIRVMAGQRLLRGKFRWSDASKRIVDAARLWSKGSESVEPAIGWVTTWNTPCGIATYSEHLIKNMPGKVTVLAAHSDSKIVEDGADVRRCWMPGEHDELIDLGKLIQEIKLDTLVIQFNYGFFDLHKFGTFLNEQVDLGRTIVVTMHATVDPVHMPHKKLEIVSQALKRCHRILVHTPHDMNRLKRLGVIDNVAIFPHGLVEYVPPKATIKKGGEFVVATYGFFLPHKGLLELIEAVSILKSNGRKIRLDMTNAEYPVPQSRDIIEQANKKIKALNLDGDVSMCTDFLEDRESFAKMAEADLIVFPYQETGESSSAAVRYGLAAGRPVAVTPLPIFDDVDLAVHRLPGQSPVEIANGIAALMDSFAQGSEKVSEKAVLADRWREEHRYSRVGARLYNILTALNSLRKVRGF